MQIKTRIELLAFGNEGEERYAEFEARDDAEVNELLEQSFYYGQNDFQPQQHPSASVGDVVWMNGHAYLIKPVGFRKLTTEDLAAYRKTPRRERSICFLFCEDDEELRFETEIETNITDEYLAKRGQ